MLRFTVAVALILVVGASPPPTPAASTNSSPTAQNPETFFDFYARNVRQSLFSGFLTLGSFLVAVNTFIVVQLKKELYDQKAYKNKVRANRKENPNTSFYGPLKRLSALLIGVIALSIVTAVLQLTVGIFLTNSIGASICIGAAGFTLLMLFVVLWLIRANLRDWFDHCEQEARSEDSGSSL